MAIALIIADIVAIGRFVRQGICCPFAQAHFCAAVTSNNAVCRARSARHGTGDTQRIRQLLEFFVAFMLPRVMEGDLPAPVYLSHRIE